MIALGVLIIAVSLVMAAVDLVVEFAMLPRGGNAPMTREDCGAKVEQTRRLTHDIFDEDIERMRDTQQSKLDGITGSMASINSITGSAQRIRGKFLPPSDSPKAGKCSFPTLMGIESGQ